MSILDFMGKRDRVQDDSVFVRPLNFDHSVPRWRRAPHKLGHRLRHLWERDRALYHPCHRHHRSRSGDQENLSSKSHPRLRRSFSPSQLSRSCFPVSRTTPFNQGMASQMVMRARASEVLLSNVLISSCHLSPQHTQYGPETLLRVSLSNRRKPKLRNANADGEYG